MRTLDSPGDVFLPPEHFVGRWLRGLLPRERCDQLIADFEARAFEPTAMQYPRDYRNNDRLVFDDAALATELLERSKPQLPELLIIDGARFELRSLNPRFRACRYRDGQSFCVHRDGPYVPSDARRSLLTLQVYLNDAQGFTGGRTRFYADQRASQQWAALSPEAGSAIIFDHRAWHDGEAVTFGTKFVLRTDVVYDRVSVAESWPDDRRLVGQHRGYVWQALPCADGSVLSAGRDGTVRRWRAGQGQVLETPLPGSVTALTMAGDGRVWCGTRAGQLGVLGSANWPGAGSAAVLGLAAVGAGVASVTASGELNLFDRDGVRQWSSRVHEGWGWCVASLGAHLLSGGEDGRVVLSPKGGDAVELVQLSAPVRALVVAGDGTVVAGDAAGMLHRLTTDGQVVKRWQGHDAAVTSLAIASDGQLASGGEDSRVRRWRGERLQSELASSDFITSVGFTTSGALIFAGYDGAIWQRAAVT